MAADVIPAGVNRFVISDRRRLHILDAQRCQVIETIRVSEGTAIEQAVGVGNEMVLAGVSFPSKETLVSTLIVHDQGEARARVVPLPSAVNLTLSADGRVVAYASKEQVLFFWTSDFMSPDPKPTITLAFREANDQQMSWLLALLSRSAAELTGAAVQLKLPHATLTATSRDGSLLLMDGGRSIPLQLPRGIPRKLALSSDAWLAASETSSAVGAGSHVSLFDLRTGHEIDRRKSPGRLLDLTFTPDGQELVTAWADGSVRRELVPTSWQDGSWLARFGVAVSGHRLSGATTEPLDPVEHRKTRTQLLESLRTAACSSRLADYALDHFEATKPACGASP